MFATLLTRTRSLLKNDRAYELLPTNAGGGGGTAVPDSAAPLTHLWRSCYRSRLVRGLVLLFLLFVIAPLSSKKWKERSRREGTQQGFYGFAAEKEYERNLPQHNMELNWPEGKRGRYVKFDVPYNHIGFNNQFQDILMSGEMAYLSNRAYAFQPFIWEMWTTDQLVKSDDGVTLRSARIPLNAFISGPTAGGHMSMPAPGWDVTAPRAVSYDFFEEVCPPWRRTYVDVPTVRKKWGIEEDKKPDGGKMLEAWGKELGSMNETCVVVGGDHAWTWDAFGPRVLGSWPYLQRSPNMVNFQWAPLIHHIVQRNLPLLLGVKTPPSSSPVPKTLKGLVAVHLRRGDFEQHCKWLAYLHAEYNGWNAFPTYVDRFDDEEERKDEEKFIQRCLPTPTQLVERLRVIKREWEAVHGKEGHELTRVYVLNNAEELFMMDLKQGLMDDGWEAVHGTLDMDVGRKGREVDMVADMMIAHLAEVFVGNGWSSLTSNINLIRLASDVPSDSIRML